MFRNTFFNHLIFNSKSSILNGETMENTKKISAAISAVMNYIKTEEEAIYIQSLAVPAVEPIPEAYAAAPVKLWGMSGRQAQMQMRNMMQMRTFK
jgi:hypothetical protein